MNDFFEIIMISLFLKYKIREKFQYDWVTLNLNKCGTRSGNINRKWKVSLELEPKWRSFLTKTEIVLTPLHLLLESTPEQKRTNTIEVLIVTIQKRT